MFRIGNHDGFRRIAPHLRDLSEDTACVQNSLSFKAAIHLPFVQEHTMTQRIHINAQDASDRAFVSDIVDGVVEITKPTIFFSQRGHGLQIEIGIAQGSGQRFIFGA